MKKTLSIFFLLFALSGFAQQTQTTLPSMRGVYQASFINPAFTPEYKTTFALPVLGNLNLRFNLTGFDMHTIAQSIDDSGMLDTKLLYDNLDGPIGFNIPLNFDLFYLRFPIKGYYIGIHNSIRANQNIVNISKEFLGFISMGNDFFIGKEQDYDLLNIKLNVYNETGFSISKAYKRFNWGVRVKYLVGIANVQTDRIRMIVNTESTIPYKLTLQASGNIKTAGLPIALKNDSVDGRPITDDDRSTNGVIDNLKQRTNNGYGLDLGFGYQFNTNFSGWVSVIDLGSSINWKTDTYQYKLDDSKVEFGGLNYEQTSSSEKRTELIDSLKSKLGKAYITSEKYVSKIPTKYYLGLDYDLTTKDRFGAMFQGQSFEGDFYSASTLNYMRRLTKNFQFTGNYTLRNFESSDFGLGMSTRLGPLQFYFFSDNLMSFIKPNRSRSVYFSLGFNLVFGRIPKKLQAF